MQVESGDAAQRHNRRAQRAEGHRRRVRDEREAGGLQRFEAELNQDRGGDRHRSAEPRRPFKKRAKGERDQDHLNARVGRKRRQAAPQHGE